MRRYKTVLTIGSSDSCGGAGIQADIKTISSLGCYGMSVVAALTAQNTKGVQAINPVPVRFVEQQLESIFDDVQVDIVKTGLLLSADIIDKVAEFLIKYDVKKVIVDPVMIAKNKDVLLNRRAGKVLINKLFPLAAVVTPNIDEAEYILNTEISDLDSMKEAAIEISKLGAKAVLLKGGHLTKMKKSMDCLYLVNQRRFHIFENDRIKTDNTHGAGCTFGSAIASFMAQGQGLIKAIEHAKKYVTEAINAGKGYHLGSGPGPTCHFYRLEDFAKKLL